MLVVFSFGLLLACSSLLAIDPPPPSCNTCVVKKRHLQTTTVTWDYTTIPDFTLLYFRIKAAYNLNEVPVEIKQVPAQARATSFPAVFTPQYPKYVYYVVTSISQGKYGTTESLNSRTVMAERIGPPPN